MPPLLDGVISFLGIRSRSGAAVSEDEASYLAAEDVPVKKVSKKKSPKPEETFEDLVEDDGPENDEDEAEAEDEDEDEDEAGEGEFVVEAIKSHLVTEGEIMYHVKWEGYEKRSEMTWEPEENLLPSAEEILSKYLKSVGGRDAILGDEMLHKPKAKKRGRAASTNNTPENNANGKRARKNTAHPASTTPPVSLEKAVFKPPTGSWEDDVQGIDACEGTDGNVMVFLQWASGHKTQHPLEQVYKRCPQKMLRFYESHLSFAPATPASEPSTDVLIEYSRKKPGRGRGRPRKQNNPVK